jgi:hypothetical protein
LLLPSDQITNGNEFQIQRGHRGSYSELPDPRICNLALARVSYASGAAEIFDGFVSDEDEDGMQVSLFILAAFPYLMIFSCVGSRS